MLKHAMLAALTIGSFGPVGLARTGELRWTTGAGSFPLSPLNAYPQAGDVETYLEARGLPAAGEVEVRLRLSAEERPDESAVELRFMERPRDGRLVLRQTISLAGLEPGFYVLTAEIALPDGRDIARSQRLAVSP